MDREETREVGVDRTWHAPAGSGIVVGEDRGGIRITLPRLFTQGDVIVAGLAAAVAVWMAAWADAMAADPTATTLGWGVMAGIALLFGLLAVSQVVPVVAPRVIQDRGDRIVLSRAVGVRLIFRRELPKSAIHSVDRVREEGDAEAGEPGVVRIRTGRHDYRLGRGLEPWAAAWLEDAVRAMADPGGTPAVGPPPQA